MEKSDRKKIGLIIAGILFGVLAIATIIIAIISATRSAKLDILVAPISADVFIDGKKYENGIYNFAPGEVAVVISKDGFESKEEKITLKAGETTKLYTYLLPADGSYDWYLSHEKDMMLLNTIGDAKASEDSGKYLQQNPIVEVLPIIYANYDEDLNYTEYRIDGGKFEECEREFCLKITDTTGGNYDKAIADIEKKGFTASDYEIIYKYKPITDL